MTGTRQWISLASIYEIEPPRWYLHTTSRTIRLTNNKGTKEKELEGTVVVWWQQRRELAALEGTWPLYSSRDG